MSAAERSVSPTTQLWDGRRQAQEKMVAMTRMGLHVFNPAWQQTVDSSTIGARYSASFTETTLSIFGSSETMTFPVQTCTRMKDLREALAHSCMVQPEDLTFVVKQGCNHRKPLDSEEVPRRAVVKGVSSFKPAPYTWPHPVCILGTGYNGIKTAMTYMKEGNDNFVCFDRYDRVGGYCWLYAANKHSKLQTEMGAFHVWYGPEFVQSGLCGGWPTEWEPWPKKDRVLEHFQVAAEEYGILPNCRFRTNVSEMDIVGPKDALDRHYNLTLTPMDGGEPYQLPVSLMYNYPGSMTKNRLIDYPGEDTFEGQIGYGMNDDLPYDHLDHSISAILGNGAFAVENVRTCCEYGATKVYLVTRRKNLPSPRVPCWFVHQGPLPTPGRMVLEMFQPMFKLAGMGDPWEYWGVHAPADRSRATIIQNSRFGIGDFTFLALIYGKMEYVETTLKRISGHTLHLSNGDKLENVTVLIKALGLLGDFDVDRLHKMKEMVGNFCSGDYRRVVQIDPLGMNAANFTTFSTGIGSYSTIINYKYMHDFPKEYDRMASMGLLQQLPRQKADEKLDRPAYLVDVKFQMAAGVIFDAMNPKLSERHAALPNYKYELYHRAYPLDKFLQTCRDDWDQYQEAWKKQGCEHEYVPYPYTREMVEEYVKDYNQVWGMNCSADGPESIRRGNSTSLAIPEGSNEMTRQAVDTIVNTEHIAYWLQEGPKQNPQFSKNMQNPQIRAILQARGKTVALPALSHAVGRA